MRFIGSISDAVLATRFGDYLTALGIANEIEQGSSGFAVWVHNDDHIDRSKDELSSFLAEPTAGRFAEAGNAAQRVRDEHARREKSLRKNYVDVRTSWAALSSRPMPLTIALVAICAIVALMTRLGANESAAGELLSFGTLTAAEENEVVAKQITQRVREMTGRSEPAARKFELRPPGLDNILRGQIWRLFTPMFLHFGIMHFAFNMIWLIDLGGMIERKRGTLIFLAIVLTTSLLANVAQFYWNGPYFGGMSGVVYGLFGYIWVKSRIEPQLGLVVRQQTVLIMMIWLAICMVGVISNVANAAHVVGLLTGLALAHAPYSWRKLRRRSRAA